MAVPTVQLIGPRFAQQRIRPLMSREDVVTRPSIEIVISDSPRELVDPVAPVQHIVALFPEKLVIVGPTIQQIIARAPHQEIVPRSAF